MEQIKGLFIDALKEKVWNPPVFQIGIHHWKNSEIDLVNPIIKDFTTWLVFYCEANLEGWKKPRAELKWNSHFTCIPQVITF